LHLNLNKECSLLTSYNTVQGTGCNLSSDETVVEEWQTNSDINEVLIGCSKVGVIFQAYSKWCQWMVLRKT